MNETKTWKQMVCEENKRQIWIQQWSRAIRLCRGQTNAVPWLCSATLWLSIALSREEVMAAEGHMCVLTRGLCLFRVSYHCAVNYGETKAHQFGIPSHHHGTIVRSKEA